MPGTEKYRTPAQQGPRRVNFHRHDLADLTLVRNKLPKQILVTERIKLTTMSDVRDDEDEAAAAATAAAAAAAAAAATAATTTAAAEESSNRVTITATSPEITSFPPSSSDHEAENSDCDTELGDVGQENEYDDFHDLNVVGRRLYEKRCREIGVVPISMFLRNFADTNIKLASHQCGTRGLEALSAALSYNRKLRSLDLSENGIEDSGIRHLTPRLIEHDLLKELILTDNKLSADGVRWLCRLVLANRSIKCLKLAGNHVGDSATEALAGLLEGGECMLTELDLSNNNFSEEAGMVLGPAIGENVHLEVLDLSWNHIRKKGAVAIAKGLKENVKLQKVNLGWNGFGREGAKAIGEALMENESLQILDVTANRFTDQDVLSLARGISCNTALHTLILVQNLFTHIGASGILKSIQQNENSALCFINMKGVIVKQNFMNELHQLQSKQVLEIECDKFPPRRFNNPSKTLIHFIIDSNKTLKDIFPGVTDDSQDKCATKEEFVDKFKSIGVPVSEQQLEDLATRLDKQDRGIIDITSLFTLEAKIRTSRNS